MPTLTQLTATILLSPSTPLKEYNTTYTNGSVETFIAVPTATLPFQICIRSHGYIAPGLAVFVFMDGVYQANRNKLGLKLPGDGVPPKEYEIDLNMRQKEEKIADGMFVGRDWTFGELDAGMFFVSSKVEYVKLTTYVLQQRQMKRRL